MDEVLVEYGLPEQAPVEQLRGLTRVAATVCGVPNAVVNLLDGCFQHQVGSVGFEGETSDVADSMCAAARRDERLAYLPDASAEAAFAGNPWVDGRLASVRLYASAPLRLQDGRTLGSLCVFAEQPGSLDAAQLAALDDLARQAVSLFEHAHQARADRRRSALLTTVLETIDVGIAACDADGRLTLFNRATRDMVGLPEDASLQAQDWSVHYSAHREDGTPLPPDDSPLRRALRDGSVSDATVVLAPTGRPPITLSCTGRAMVDDDGKLLGAVVAQTDVTADRARSRELTAAYDEAQAATRAKTAFLAAASHEIRTPLNGVLGLLDVLAISGLTPEQRNQVELAQQSGEALLRLLNDVLDLSKAETTAVTLAARPFRPADVAADVVAALEPVAVRKGLRLWLADATEDRLVGDDGRIRQILMNLVGNAVKFTERGQVLVTVGTVPVPGQPDRARLRIEVADTGSGMAEAEMDQLFRPFVQGRQGARYGGTGLGLTLSQQLVELMGGRLGVTSEPGSGSVFSVDVELPRSADAAPAPAPELEVLQDDAPAPVAAPSVPVRVLVADDNDVNRMVAEALLSAEGAQVVTVADGDEAVDAVRDQVFDLVLLDLQMPRMSGVDAARAIRQLPGASGRTRLLALTAASTADDRAACSAVGMEGYLLKPLRRAQLRGLLADATAG